MIVWSVLLLLTLFCTLLKSSFVSSPNGLSLKQSSMNIHGNLTVDGIINSFEMNSIVSKVQSHLERVNSLHSFSKDSRIQKVQYLRTPSLASDYTTPFRWYFVPNPEQPTFFMSRGGNQLKVNKKGNILTGQSEIVRNNNPGSPLQYNKHSCMTDNARAFVFGGKSGASSDPLPLLQEFSFDTFLWTSVTLSSIPGREYPQLACRGIQLLIAGGKYLQVLDDFYIIDVLGSDLSNVVVSESTNMPHPKYRGFQFYYKFPDSEKEYFIVLGGQDSSDINNDIYLTSDMKTWNESPVVNGESFTPRDVSSTASYKNIFYSFGGNNDGWIHELLKFRLNEDGSLDVSEIPFENGLTIPDTEPSGCLVAARVLACFNKDGYDGIMYFV